MKGKLQSKTLATTTPNPRTLSRYRRVVLSVKPNSRSVRGVSCLAAVHLRVHETPCPSWTQQLLATANTWAFTGAVSYLQNGSVKRYST